MVAGAVLRFRTDLLAYVTTLAVSGYLLYVAQTHAFWPDKAPSFREVVPFVLSLIVIGIIQAFALKRSRAAYEMARRRRLG